MYSTGEKKDKHPPNKNRTVIMSSQKEDIYVISKQIITHVTRGIWTRKNKFSEFFFFSFYADLVILELSM